MYCHIGIITGSRWYTQFIDSWTSWSETSTWLPLYIQLTIACHLINYFSFLFVFCSQILQILFLRNKWYIYRPKKSFQFHQNDNCILWGTISDGQMRSYTFRVQPVYVQEPTIRQPVRLCAIGPKKKFWIPPKWQLHLVRDHKWWPNAKLHLPSTTRVSTGALTLTLPLTIQQPVSLCTMRFMGPKRVLRLVRDHKRWLNAKFHLPSTTGVSTGP